MIDRSFVHGVGVILLIIYIVFDLVKNKKRKELLLRRVVFYSFLYYLINLINLTIFPIDPYNFGFILDTQLIPFYFVYESFTYGLDMAYVNNLLMLLPLGIYIPLLFPRFRKLSYTLMICFLFSLSIEVTQLILNQTWGVMRQFNVDDLILNTAGAAIGFVGYKLSWLVLKKNNIPFDQSGHGRLT
ncbi:VanZ family protein [Evansella sp. AB-rgal1]|uniref:VanZ family protein n=1 Tax=Evansella sp. AB-rgal1 TaxID=3242696 RepID=UPI00359ED0A3